MLVVVPRHIPLHTHFLPLKLHMHQLPHSHNSLHSYTQLSSPNQAPVDPLRLLLKSATAGALFEIQIDAGHRTVHNKEYLLL